MESWSLQSGARPYWPRTSRSSERENCASSLCLRSKVQWALVHRARPKENMPRPPIWLWSVPRMQIGVSLAAGAAAAFVAALAAAFSALGAAATAWALAASGADAASRAGAAGATASALGVLAADAPADRARASAPGALFARRASGETPPSRLDAVAPTDASTGGAGGVAPTCATRRASRRVEARGRPDLVRLRPHGLEIRPNLLRFRRMHGAQAHAMPRPALRPALHLDRDPGAAATTPSPAPGDPARPKFGSRRASLNPSRLAAESGSRGRGGHIHIH